MRITELDLSPALTMGKGWLYSALISLYKPVYEDDERLLFYLDVPDESDYPDTKGEIEHALDQYLFDLDIPEYFVMKRFTGVVKVRDHAQDTRCILPWIHLYMHTDGSISPCCKADIVSDLSDHTDLISAVNSKEMTSLRSTMLSGKRPKQCKVCYEDEDNGLISLRMSANAEWKKYFHLIDDGQPDGIINDFKLKLYDIRSNNICNFKCRTCSGSYSSSIASEEASLGWPARSQARQNANHQTFMESVMSQIDDVESFYFAGGEPLMMIEHYNLLERLIAANRTDVSITYNTNASNLSFKGKHICDLWKHFSDINVGLSLDGMEVVAEYLRHGTKWSTILANIDEIRYKTPHVKLKVTSVWSIYNCYHLLDFHKWLITSGYFDPDSIKLEHSMGDDFDVRILDSNIKQELSSKINEMIHWLGELGSQDLIDYWRSALLHLNSKDMSHLMPAFLRRNKVLDAARNESLFRSIPNLANMLDHETDNVVK